MNLKTQLLALAIAGACATMNAEAVMKLDLTGSGNNATSIALDSIAWQPGNLLLNQGAGPDNGGTDLNGDILPTAAHMLGQSYYIINPLAANSQILTYQFDIPISTVRNSTTNETIANLGAGKFKLFLGLKNDINQAAGKGYGTLNGSVGAAGQVELLAGDVKINGDSFTFSESQLNKFFWLSEKNTVGSILTRAIAGSVSLDVDVKSQNDSYVTNDMVNAGITVDLSVITLGPLAPFDPQVPASTCVVGVGSGAGCSVVDAIKYGNNELVATVSKHDDPNGAPAAVNQSKPVNDFACFGMGALTNCDAQFQTSGNAKFRGTDAPEPATLGLIGLGLSALGLSRRRRANRKA